MVSKRHAVAALAAAFVLALLPGAAQGGTQRTQSVLTSHEAAILNVMNSVRAAHGMAPLRVDVRLQRAARSHSRYMIRTGSFAHGNFAARLRRHGARGPTFAENLFWGEGAYGRPGSIVRDWLASPGHRENILYAGFRRVGIASPLGRGARFVTADFAGS